MLNPYASFLGSQDPLQVIAATTGEIQSLLRAMGAEKAHQAPAPGKWSPREILCHLADTEMVFAFRLRQTLAEPHHVIQPFDQDLWAQQYGAYALQDALALFSAVRHWNVRLIESLSPEAKSKPVMHPERGAMTFQIVLETMAGHDINHLGQFRGILAAA